MFVWRFLRDSFVFQSHGHCQLSKKRGWLHDAGGRLFLAGVACLSTVHFARWRACAVTVGASRHLETKSEDRVIHRATAGVSLARWSGRADLHFGPSRTHYNNINWSDPRSFRRRVSRDQLRASDLCVHVSNKHCRCRDLCGNCDHSGSVRISICIWFVYRFFTLR